MKRAMKKILPLALIMAWVLTVMPMTAYAADRNWNTDVSAAGISASTLGAQPGDIIVIGVNAKGNLIIDVDNLTVTTNGVACTDVYITSTTGVTLTIDDLNITAPQGTGGTAGNDVTGSFPAIDLAGSSALIARGSNSVKGGIESAGIRVTTGQLLNISGDGELAVNAGPSKSNNAAGGAAIGGNGSYISASQDGEPCGSISIGGNVTLQLTGSSWGPALGTGGYGAGSGSIYINGNAVVRTEGVHPDNNHLHADSLVMDGGSLSAGNWNFTSIVNNNSDPLNRVDIPAGLEGSISVIKEGDAAYSYTAKTQSDGAAYIWLPSGGSYEIHVDRGGYTEVYIVDNLSPLNPGGAVSSNVVLGPQHLKKTSFFGAGIFVVPKAIAKKTAFPIKGEVVGKRITVYKYEKLHTTLIRLNKGETFTILGIANDGAALFAEKGGAEGYIALKDIGFMLEISLRATAQKKASAYTKLESGKLKRIGYYDKNQVLSIYGITGKYLINKQGSATYYLDALQWKLSLN